MPRPWVQRISSSNSMSLTPRSATALILMCRPAFWAASMPRITWSRSPQRVSSRNLSLSSVSIDTLRRFTPTAASSLAYLASWLPLVVSVSSSSAPLSRWRPRPLISDITFLRTSGSPPVSRSFLTPRRTKAEHSRSSSSSDSTSALGRKVMSSAMQ